MSEINRELQLTLQAALREAVRRRHAYLTVEHLLYALAHDDARRRGAAERGVRRRAAHRASSRTSSSEEVEKLPEGEGREPEQTLAFHRVLESALAHADERREGGGRGRRPARRDLPGARLACRDAAARAGASRASTCCTSSRTASSKLRPRAGAGEERAAPRRGRARRTRARLPDRSARRPSPRTSPSARAEGKLDPLVGRDAELERAIHVLARRRKNNPIFVGESGVGKTALAEGLAQRILAGQVPEDLRDAEIFALDLGALLAGTRYRGDFEARFKALVAAVQERAEADPLHRRDPHHPRRRLGPGRDRRRLEPAEAAAPVRRAALHRLHHLPGVPPLRERPRAGAALPAHRRERALDDDAVQILEGLAPRYEEHHGVHVREPALRAAVELSARHLTDRFLPDKAIDVMDEVGAAVRLRPGAKQRARSAVRDVEQLVARMARIPLARATPPSARGSRASTTSSARWCSARTPRSRAWCAR